MTPNWPHIVATLFVHYPYKWHGSWWNVAYWACAAGITGVVTFGLQP